MATVHVTFSGAMSSGAPVFPTTPRAKEAITSSGTSQSTTAEAKSGDFITVTSSGGAVWVRIAGTPTAAAGTDWLVTDGAAMTFGRAKDGDKVAIIDA